MNAFAKPVGYQHKLPPSFMEENSLLSLLTEFSHDSEQEDESYCQTWGNEEIVFPMSCWDKVFNLFKTEVHLKKAQSRGFIHLVNIQEELDNDDVNSVTLSCGYLDIRQKIVFYDLPENQAKAA